MIQYFIIIAAAAKNGIIADGVELNTWLVQYSRLAAIYHGVYNRIKFHQKDLWKFNVSPYQYIVIFGVEQMVCKSPCILDIWPNGLMLEPTFLITLNFILQISSQMTDLEKKLLAEANKDAKIIACRFPLPNLKPIRVIGDGIDTVWLYTLKK